MKIKSLFTSDYGMLWVLIALCVFFSLITYEEQQPEGVEAAERLVETIDAFFDRPQNVVIAGKAGEQGEAFASKTHELLIDRGWKVVGLVNGGPPSWAKPLEELLKKTQKLLFWHARKH